MKVLLTQDEVNALCISAHSIAGDPETTKRAVFSSTKQSVLQIFRGKTIYYMADIIMNKFSYGELTFKK